MTYKKTKRTDGYNKDQKLISRHYCISEKMHIELVKISIEQNKDISFIVRLALDEFIIKQNGINKRINFSNNNKIS